MENLIFHVLNRGVEKRVIFKEDQDYKRFIRGLFEFNDKNSTENLSRFLIRSKKHNKSTDGQITTAKPFVERKPRKLLVRIHSFCLMPNHYHLLLSPLVENGISKFIQKLSIGYTHYFNKKHDRSGVLFQGKHKRIQVTNSPHLTHIPFYIHLNPLDIIEPEWREGIIKDTRGSLNFLKNYRWSSHLDYLGIKNFPSVTNREFLLDYFDGYSGYRSACEKWIKERKVRALDSSRLE